MGKRGHKEGKSEGKLQRMGEKVKELSLVRPFHDNLVNWACINYTNASIE